MQYYPTRYKGVEVTRDGKVRAYGKRLGWHVCKAYETGGKTYAGQGYLSVRPSIDGKQKTLYIHRLVAETFIPNPEHKPTVNHKDGDKHNNRVDNLEWATCSENTTHAYDHRLIDKYRMGRVCAYCGKPLSDTAKSDTHGDCAYKHAAEQRRRQKQIGIAKLDASRPRNSQIQYLLRIGCTCREVADMYDLSPQRICQIGRAYTR